jgi:methylthioribose-1-phosphate isomerase
VSPVLVAGRHLRTIWLAADGGAVEIIDQTRLPHELAIVRITDVAEMALAIREMWVRGAPLIGAAAAYGMALALRADASDAGLERAATLLGAARPTAVNLAWAVDEVRRAVATLPPGARAEAAFARAAAIADDDVATCRAIGEHGAALLAELHARAGGGARAVRVLTHCNAGWLATVDWGTALAPVYAAARRGIPVHVLVEETRPRNQGMLTAWELGEEGVAHEVIVDNAGGHFLQRGEVDVVIVGTDRTTRAGDVCNKIGTYQKAVAARDAGVPFYAAVPHSSIDWRVTDWRAIPIEERAASEVSEVWGVDERGARARVRVTPARSPVRNPAFDVTPARLVTGLVTERGVCAATPAGLAGLYPERAA